MNQWFKFKNFTIKQDRCAMKVGTDGVLLGAWASGASRILDIGTGTGLIALMMAQRFPDAEVDAVEIDHEAAKQAMENVRMSPFHRRVNVFESSSQDYARTYAGMRYGAIVSNPPYFNCSMKTHDTKRTLARHTDSLSYRELFHAAGILLADDGVFSAVIPYGCRSEFVSEAVISGFFLVKETSVKTVPSKQPKRCLLAFGKNRDGEVDFEEVTMCSGKFRSSWYMDLTDDFYLAKD